MFAPILVPPLAVWIAMTWGWRWVFFSFAIPGLVIAVLWYLLVRTRPSESAFVSKAELETITVGQETPDARRENIVISPGFARLDRLIRVRDLAPVSTVKACLPRRISSAIVWPIS